VRFSRESHTSLDTDFEDCELVSSGSDSDIPKQPFRSISSPRALCQKNMSLQQVNYDDDRPPPNGTSSSNGAAAATTTGSDDVNQPSNHNGASNNTRRDVLPEHVAAFYPPEDDFSWQQDPFAGSPGSKYERYDLPVDHEEGDRAMEIKLCSWKRPHMRGFHCAWISFFLAFMIWFAVAPLLKEIQDTLHLTKKELWNSSIASDVTAIVLRVFIGPVCDTHGARIPMAVVLVVAALPTAAVGLVENATDLAVVRFFIGIAGSSFVMAQFWPSRMFSREISGTANGIVGGWGNLGGAFTQVFMGSILFPLFKDHVFDGDSEKAWRTICVIPAAMAMAWGITVAFLSDDAPMGNYKDMRHAGTMDRLFFTTALRSGAKLNTGILCVQYGCCFGVELVMNNASVLYFSSEFGLSTEEAARLGFVFGSFNIFARGLGGYISDQLNLKNGLRGRLWLQTVLLVLEGALIIVFAYTNTLSGAIATMCVFSVFTQSAKGAIFGVVPYVSKLYTGSVSGLVGAGGNVGSVVFSLGFRSLSYQDAFFMMGSIAMASSILSIWIRIPCHAGLLTGEDNNAVIKARERYMKRRERDFQNASVMRFAQPPVASAAIGTRDIELAEAPAEKAEDAAPSVVAGNAAVGIEGDNR
jgi:MFS transporter, NNP family, nitrate/nitrite transporter